MFLIILVLVLSIYKKLPMISPTLNNMQSKVIANLAFHILIYMSKFFLELGVY